MRLRHFQRKRGVVISLIIEQKRREADHAVPVGQMIEMPETFGRVRKKREIRLDAERRNQAQRRRIANIEGIVHHPADHLLIRRMSFRREMRCARGVPKMINAQHDIPGLPDGVG